MATGNWLFKTGQMIQFPKLYLKGVNEFIKVDFFFRSVICQLLVASSQKLFINLSKSQRATKLILLPDSQDYSSKVLKSPSGKPNALAFSTRRIIFPLRVLGS